MLLIQNISLSWLLRCESACVSGTLSRLNVWWPMHFLCKSFIFILINQLRNYEINPSQEHFRRFVSNRKNINSLAPNFFFHNIFEFNFLLFLESSSRHRFLFLGFLGFFLGGSGLLPKPTLGFSHFDLHSVPKIEIRLHKPTV